MEKLFYIFRHGQSTYNISGIIQGQTNDSVLTNQGRQQAFRLGEKLCDKNIDLFISSPLKRARETAEIANQLLNVPISEDSRFTEVNIGELEGLHFTEVNEKYAEQYDEWRNGSDENFRFKNGESKKEVRGRTFSALFDYAENYKQQNFAISTHGIVLSQILFYLNEPTFNIPNGTLLCIGYDGTWHFKKFI